MTNPDIFATKQDIQDKEMEAKKKLRNTERRLRNAMTCNYL